MLCSKCGREIGGKGAFCPYCGEPTGRLAEPAKRDAEPVPQPEPAPEPEFAEAGATAPLAPDPVSTGATAPLAPEPVSAGATAPLASNPVSAGATTPLAPEPAPASAGAAHPLGFDPATLPVYTPPAFVPPAPPYAPPVQKPRQNAGIRTLCVFLSILLCLALIASCAVTIVRNSISKDTISSMIKDLEPKSITLPSPKGTGKTVTISEAICEALEDYADDVPMLKDLTPADVDAILDSDAVKDFLSSTMGEYSDFLLNGAEVEGLSVDKIIGFVEDNEDELMELAKDAGLEVDDSRHIDTRELREALEDADLDALSPMTLMSADKSSSGAGKALAVAQKLLAPWVMYTCWSVAGGLMLLLILLNLKYPRHMLSDIGIPANITGVLYFFPAAVLYIFSLVGKEDLFGIPKAVFQLLEKMLIPFLIFGGGLMVISILLLVIKRVTRPKLGQPKKQKKVKNAA